MKTLWLTGLLLLLGTNAVAAYKVSNISLQWTAFKTPQKIGVKGTFSDMKLQAHRTQSLNSALLGTSLVIDPKSVSTGNSGRDLTLVSSYFDLFEAPKIKGTIVKVTDKNLVVALEMNGHKQNIMMDYTFATETSMQLNGTLDMLKFGLDNALKSISQACFDLHKGKTWSDVDVKVVFTIED